jgi:hypothetical protein
MSRRTFIWVAILALSAIVLLKGVQLHPKDPVSDSQPLSYWLGRIDDQSDPIAHMNAGPAIRSMGSNALPNLLHMLRRHDWPMQRYFVSRVSRHPWLKSKLKLRPPPEQDWRLALEAIAFLGPAGQPALKDVLPLASNQDRAVKIKAFFALTSMRPQTEFVRPIFPTLMQATGDAEWTMRLAALNTLAALQPPPPEATSACIRFLNDSNEWVSDAAINHLVAWTNPIVIPTLDKELHDNDNYTVSTAATQIAVFGAAAGASAARLRELLSDPLLTVRDAATNALAAITGQSPSNSASAEKPYISYNFPRLPLEQFLDEYEYLAGKKVTRQAKLYRSQTVRVITVRPLTKSEALTLCEEVLKEQAGLIIVHEKDGSLTAMTKPKTE